MNPLGDCEKCHGPLCIGSRIANGVSTGVVKCERCGHEHPDHPMAPKDFVPEKPRATNIPTRDFGASLMDRVNALERTVHALSERVVQLEQAAAEKTAEPELAEPVGAGRSGKRR